MHNQAPALNKKFSTVGLDTVALRKFEKACERPTFMSLRVKRVREQQLVIVRNKYTKEIVDLEVDI